jgi:putative addiction module killer protein
MEPIEQEVIFYRDERGRENFVDWLRELTAKERTVVLDRLSRVKQGNFGDIKPIGGEKGLFELRFHFGQGIRAFYGRDGNKIVVLLNGSDKGDQEKTLKQAIKLWNEYQARKKSSTAR